MPLLLQPHTPTYACVATMLTLKSVMLGLHNFFRIIIILYVSLLDRVQVLGIYHLHEAAF